MLSRQMYAFSDRRPPRVPRFFARQRGGWRFVASLSHILRKFAVAAVRHDGQPAASYLFNHDQYPFPNHIDGSSPRRTAPRGRRARPARLCRQADGRVALPPPCRRHRRDDQYLQSRPRASGRPLHGGRHAPRRQPALRRWHGEVPLPHRRRPLRGERLYPRRRPRHAVRVVAGGLQDGLRLLHDRPAGL